MREEAKRVRRLEMCIRVRGQKPVFSKMNGFPPALHFLQRQFHTFFYFFKRNYLFGGIKKGDIGRMGLIRSGLRLPKPVFVEPVSLAHAPTDEVAVNGAFERSLGNSNDDGWQYWPVGRIGCGQIKYPKRKR